MSRLSLHVDSSSLQQLHARMLQAVDRAFDVGREAVAAEMITNFNSAQEKCPVYTGKLKSSGKMSTQVGDKQVEGTISYGASYAGERHEQITRRNPAAYKWLERTMLGSAPNTQQSLAKRFQDMFEEG